MTKKRLSYAERHRFATNALAQQLFLLLDKKKTNLALSADVTNCDTLLTLADQLGPEICILKTHVDILENFTPRFSIALSQLAQKHEFFIFEDRKFADIGNTVKNQYQGGIYRIADWAHIINAHSLPGPGIIEGLREVGLDKKRAVLLLAEMSSANNLFDREYAQKTLHMAEQFRNFVIGFIAQKKLSDDNSWIYMTPGVQFNENKDNLGQQYITPEKAIIENESDIIIVGRGILHAANPIAKARRYREAAWAAYSARLS
ncbi:MAG: orotidine-5'-phosphate decarboxylase [Gammaproteobacteria bacterium]|nr:orotidine-5'-phosphate decarboxylase [Gammaproteobacteria bacterium]